MLTFLTLGLGLGLVTCNLLLDFLTLTLINLYWYKPIINCNYSYIPSGIIHINSTPERLFEYIYIDIIIIYISMSEAIQLCTRL